MHKSRRHYKSVVTIVIVCATLLVLPGIASADIMFDTTAGGDWLLDDDSVENRKFDSFEIVGSNEIPSYWDVTEEIPPSGEWHDDCSSTSGWIYASSWDGWRPWTFASGTLASDNGYLHMQTINGWATGPMWYKELNDVFTLSDFVSFEVDMEMIQPTSYYKGCYMTILYDEVKQPVMYLYGAEWTDAAKDIDLYASFFPAAGGSVTHNRLNIGSDFRGVLSLYYQEGTGLKASIPGTSDSVLLNEQQWAAEAGQKVKYVAVAWREGSGTFLDTRCHDIKVEYVGINEWHDDCSSTSGWTYASSWDGWRPWTFASGTLASDNGYIHTPSNSGWATGPMWYKELNDAFTLSDFVSFEVDMEMIQPTAYYKGCFITILYDEVKQPVMYLYGAEWNGAEKDIDLYVRFFPDAGGSVTHSRLNIGTDFRGVLSLVHQEGTGLVASIPGISDSVLLNEQEWAAEAGQQIKYVAVAWRRGSGVFLDTRCHDIKIKNLGSPEPGVWNIHDSSTARTVTTSARIYSDTVVKMSQQLDQETTDVIMGQNVHFGFWFRSTDGKPAQACFEYIDGGTPQAVESEWFPASTESGYLAWAYAYVEVPASVINTIDAGTLPTVVIRVAAAPTGYIYIDDAAFAIFYTVEAEVRTEDASNAYLGEVSLSLFVWSHDWDPIEDNKRNMYVTASIHCKTIDVIDQELVAIDGFVFGVKMLPEFWWIFWQTSQYGDVDIVSEQEANDQDFFDNTGSGSAIIDANMITTTSAISNTIELLLISAEGVAGLAGAIVIDVAVGTLFEVAAALGSGEAHGPSIWYEAVESVGYTIYNSGQGYGENMIRDATFTIAFEWSYWTKDPVNPNIILPFEDYSLQIMGRSFVQTYMSPSSVWRYSYTDIYQNIELQP